jgi:hypothetical protein
MMYGIRRSYFWLPALLLWETAAAQSPAPNVVLVLTPDFCSTVMTKGSGLMKEKFAVGAPACPALENALKKVFPGLTRADSEPAVGSGSAMAVLIPRFSDLGATTTMGAFSNRELVVMIEWRAKDGNGKDLWIETAQGSAKHHSGNSFTASKNRKRIIEDAVENLAQTSADKMAAAPELRTLRPAP